ncbi:CASP-like protein [Quillaja saponaria]|uniref:CASP-like protein n=1 Tax=Quillaja saponaria TaxID=32244 RepID=A0AAD7PWJ3_QUISA|nr:CASP-like protein [Quillaja saponaria]
MYKINKMALRNEGKTEGGVSPKAMAKGYWILLLLRLVAFSATTSATIVMALNKETKSFVIATIGSTPITATITAKFHHTPAFVFFVIVNGMASFHNLLMIAVDILGPDFDYKGMRLALIAILDVMTLALASAGDGAATFMADLGRNGNSHARWDKICDKFHTYCNHGGGALIASFIGIILMLVITVMSIVKLLKSNRVNHSVLP